MSAMADTTPNPTANETQHDRWNNVAGQAWVKVADVLEAQLAPMGLAAMDRLGIDPGHDVLDVGCGGGDTTIELARRTGPDGTVVGLDISAVMLARAAAAADAAGLANTSFVQADAQVHDFGAGVFDRAFSRFGVMFFADPVTAFANIRGALRTGGRLGFACWGAESGNEWSKISRLIVERYVELPPPPGPGSPGPSSLAPVDHCRAVLTGAGFVEVEVDKVTMPYRLAAPGASVADAVETQLSLGGARDALAERPDIEAELRADLTDALNERTGEDGLVFDTAVNLVVATAP